MPTQTAIKLNTPGAFAPIVKREVHLRPSLNNGCILRVQRVHRYHSTKFEKLHCITDWTGIDPCCGSGGVFLACQSFPANPEHYSLDREQKEFLKN